MAAGKKNVRGIVSKWLITIHIPNHEYPVDLIHRNICIVSKFTTNLRQSGNKKKRKIYNISYIKWFS